jgi:hypothetical protein
MATDIGQRPSRALDADGARLTHPAPRLRRVGLTSAAAPKRSIPSESQQDSSATVPSLPSLQSTRAGIWDAGQLQAWSAFLKLQTFSRDASG